MVARNGANPRRLVVLGGALMIMVLLVWMLTGGTSSDHGEVNVKPARLPVLPKTENLEWRRPSKEVVTSGSNSAAQLAAKVAIVTERKDDIDRSLKAYGLSLESPIESLKRAIGESTEPFVLVSLSGSVDVEVIAHHVKLLDAYGDLFDAVGLGAQDNLHFVNENGVLWIVQHQTPASSQCSVVDLLESDFIMKRETLAPLLASTNTNNTLLEIFYKLYEKRRPVLTCTASTQVRRSSLFEYQQVNWRFQAAHGLIDVIDERTDEFKRVHGEGPLVYCNTTFSKAWNETHGKQHGRAIKNPRSTLFDWKMVLDELDYPLKISSGTLLGWFRQCDFIPYTSDIDTTLPIYLWTPRLIEIAERHGFKLVRKFGNSSLDDPVGGWETTFQHIATKNDLDVFFSYQDVDGKDWTSLWIGGNQLNRVYFARDILMDTKEADFQGIRVMIPKNPVLYLYSSYDKHWSTPISKWTWWNSVTNQFKPPFARWPAVHNISTHYMVDRWRQENILAIREQNIKKGYIQP